VDDRFQRILESCQPYLVTSTYSTASNPGQPPQGVVIDPEFHFDPMKLRSGPFLNILQRLDELTFGTIGMTMPRWVFYDCAEVPGGIFGFARPAAELPDWVRRALEVPTDYDGMVPLSMYVAIPMLEPGAWHTYTLCSLNEVAPGSAPAGLRLLTEATGMQIFNIETAWGATQWRSPKLGVHSRFGPLDLVTAWTPAHSDPWTLTFNFPVTSARIERALAPGEPDASAADIRWIDCDEESELRTLQSELESGRHFQVVGAPVIDGSFTRVPIREVQ
jgi:hypothetical protein